MRQYHIVIEPSLTDESFWNKMREKAPNAVADFFQFFEEYKREQNWSAIFDPTGSLSEDQLPKFQDLPYYFQLAVWIAYVNTWGGCSYEVDLFDWSLAEDIENYLIENVVEWVS